MRHGHCVLQGGVGENMSLRKRARSLRRADSASELPLLRGDHGRACIHGQHLQ